MKLSDKKIKFFSEAEALKITYLIVIVMKMQTNFCRARKFNNNLNVQLLWNYTTFYTWLYITCSL